MCSNFCIAQEYNFLQRGTNVRTNEWILFFLLMVLYQGKKAKPLQQSVFLLNLTDFWNAYTFLLNPTIQWGKKVFSQPPIVQVLPLKKMREACNFHHRYTSTMRDKIRKKNPENHIVGFLRIYLQIMVENKYLVNNKISSWYFVIYPLLAMTEVKRFL